MNCTYIIYSSFIDKYYIGATQESVTDRLEKHNKANYGNKSFTALAKDWEFVLIFICHDFKHAINLERKIKSMKSRVYINNLLKYNDLCFKILEETSKSGT